MRLHEFFYPDSKKIFLFSFLFMFSLIWLGAFQSPPQYYLIVMSFLYYYCCHLMVSLEKHQDWRNEYKIAWDGMLGAALLSGSLIAFSYDWLLGLVSYPVILGLHFLYYHRT